MPLPLLVQRCKTDHHLVHYLLIAVKRTQRATLDLSFGLFTQYKWYRHYFASRLNHRHLTTDLERSPALNGWLKGKDHHPYDHRIHQRWICRRLYPIRQLSELSDSLVGVGELEALRAVWNEEVLGEDGSRGW